nr:MAG: RNA-dependent RNA polymerase [Riboviria sp.]WKV33836.1 MAG: RNA-dependent RNA polymerase [Riboviria sp.]
MYTDAVESLKVEPLTERDSWLTTFVKAEKICLWKKPDPAPRVIQPRSPRYNVELGCYLRHIEHRCFDNIHKLFTRDFPQNYKGATVFKGMDADVGGQVMANIWAEFDHPIAIGMDASRFDQHVSKDILEWEHSIYTSLYSGEPSLPFLRQLLRWQVQNRGIARCPSGTIKYTVEGCRMSGDMNTSLGNCIIMCGMIWTMMREIGITKYRLANNGDDCVLFVERGNVDKIMSAVPGYFMSLGFNMAVEEPVDCLERVEFCQTNPIFVGGSYRLVRTLTSLTKDSYSLKQLQHTAVARDWLSAVGTGGVSLNSGVPVMQAHYLRYPTNGCKDVISSQGVGMFEYKFRSNRPSIASEITAESRYSYYLATGLTPDEQVALERTFLPLTVERWDGCVVQPTNLVCASRVR